jgi:hypothetical protein
LLSIANNQQHFKNKQLDSCLLPSISIANNVSCLALFDFFSMQKKPYVSFIMSPGISYLFVKYQGSPGSSLPQPHGHGTATTTTFINFPFVTEKLILQQTS